MNEQRDLFGARVGEYELPSNTYSAMCRSCNAMIVWARTGKGKAVPLSVTTVEWRDGKGYALSHFADCPDAKKWSKR